VSGVLLVLNAGSSSLKFAIYALVDRPAPGNRLFAGHCDGLGDGARLRVRGGDGRMLVDAPLPGVGDHAQALDRVLAWVDESGLTLAAAGHRVVHGGAHRRAPARLDAPLLAELQALVPLAPLHQPAALAAIAALADRDPALPQTASFDTAFHHDQPAVATAFALPRRLGAQGIRRYGFHGLSYDYIAGVLPDYLGTRAAEGRVIVAHLGAGVSLCALQARRSIATTMGFTALDGPPMARRCGTIDPGVLLYLLQQRGMTAADVSTMLYEQSGLLGVSGLSDDMRVLLASADPRAAEAIDLFVYRIGREIGSLAAALGGVDAVVFTAGIGEHAVEVRRRIGAGAAWLGVEIDDDANAAGGPRISRPHSRVSAWVIPTDEDLVVARQAWDVLHADLASA